MTSFLSSRSFFRTIIVYLGSSWVLIEAANYFINRYQYPDYYIDILVILLIFGLFSFVLIEWQSSNNEQQKQSVLPLGLHAVNIVVAFSVAYFYWNDAQTKYIKYQQNLEDKVSIAIMPFKNINSDSSSVWLGDAVCDQIIDQLTYIESIDVKSRSASFYFKDKDYNSVQIAGLLGVNKLLEGSVMLVDTMLRISVKLMNPITGSQLWSQSFNRPISSIMEIQSEIAQTVANKINADISKDEEDKINSKLTNNSEAYEAYMKGKYHYYLVTMADNKRAHDYFQRAIELDENFIMAHAYLGLTYDMFGGMWLGLTPDSAYQIIDEIVNKIHSIDEGNAMGIFLKSNVVFFYERDYDRGIKLARESFDKIYNKEDIIWFYVMMLSMNREADESISILDDYIAKNPTSAKAYQGLCHARLMKNGRERDTPIEYFYQPCFKCMELDPSIIWGKYYLAELHFMRGEFKESRKYWQEMADIAPIPMFYEGIMRTSYYLGDTTEAVKYYDLVMMGANQGMASPIVLSRVYSTLNQIDSVAKYLEMAYQISDIELVALWSEPAYDPVRDEPKFIEIANRLQNAKPLAESN